MAGCQNAPITDEPITIQATELPADVRESYDILIAEGSFLNQRTAAARTLLDLGRPEALRILAWGLDPLRDTQVNQAVLQAMYADGDEPNAALWPALFDRLDSLPPALTQDFSLAASVFRGKAYEVQLARAALDPLRTVPARRNATIALGKRPTKPSAQTLLQLTAPNQPPVLRETAFEALATLTGRGDLGADASAWNQWWDQARSLNAAQWERQLRENFSRQEANEDMTIAQVVDRLRELSITLYRLAPEGDKPRVLNSFLTETLLPMRELGVSLAEQRLASGGTFEEPLRASLREVLVGEDDELRQRTATLLRDMADEPAADRVTERLLNGEESVTSVQAAYLLLLERMPRADAVEPALALMLDSALGPQAAAALASAARSGLLQNAQRRQVVRNVRSLLDASPNQPHPELVTLAGRVGDDQDFTRIAGWLDHPEPTIRQAAARAWADSSRSLLPLAERADDPIIQPIVITAARQRGQDPQTLRTLALFPPAPGSAARTAWSQSLAVMAERVAPDQPDQVLAAALVLPAETLAEQRESLLTLGLQARANDTPPGPAHVAMLLERAQLRLQTGRARLAVLDFEALLPHDSLLTPDQLEDRDRGLIRALLRTDQLANAFGVARRLYEAPNGQLVQPAPDDPIIGLFIDAAETHVRNGRGPQALQVLEELRLLLGPTMKPEVALRIGAIEQQAQPPAAPNASAAPDPAATQEAQPSPDPETSDTNESTESQAVQSSS